MLNGVRIDHRVLRGFLILMCAMNAAVFLISWGEIMAGKNDFPVFYSNAQMVHEGHASKLYDFDAENSLVRRVSDVMRPPNNHLPYELLIFIPFIYMRFGAAFALWTLVGLGMLLGIVLLMRDCWRERWSFWLAFVSVLAFFPVWQCLLQGQDSILLTLLFALSFWLWRRGQDGRAGFALALGLFRLQLVLPLVVVAFFGGRLKFIRGFIPGAVLVVALSTRVVGFHGMVEYVRTLVLQGTEGSAGVLGNHWQVWPGLMPTARGLLWVCVPSSAPGIVRNVPLISATIGALAWAAKRMRNAGAAAGFDLAFAVAVGVVSLVSFHSYLHDFSLLILPLLIAGGAVASSAQVTQKKAYAIVTIGFLFFFSPLYLVLIFTDRIGLFVLPTVGLLWLIAGHDIDSLPAFAAEDCPAEVISPRPA
ncbi:MAG: glycosyltransferase family 87 protein [Candidatus Acidiferrales bacterium]